MSQEKDRTVLELNQSKINPHMFIINNLENNVLEAEVITVIDIVGQGSWLMSSFHFKITFWPWKASFLVIVICSVMYLSAWFSIRQFLGLNCRSVQRDSKFYYTRNPSPAVSNRQLFYYQPMYWNFFNSGISRLMRAIWNYDFADMGVVNKCGSSWV